MIVKRKLSAKELRILRHASTAGTYKHGVGGILKKGHRAPKPITLRKIKGVE